MDRSDTTMDDELLFRTVTAHSTPDEQARIAEWLALSQANADRLQEVATVLRFTTAADDLLDFGRPPTGQEMLGSQREGRRAPALHATTWRLAILAAATLAGVALAVPIAQSLSDRESGEVPTTSGSDEFTTESQPATVGLRDGTVIRLAPSTRLRLHEYGDSREVSLTGRGYFAVAHDHEMPFTVRSDAGTVTVVGTRFDLTASGDDLNLIVIEGRVRLATRGANVDVHAGQLARVIGGNLVAPIDVPDPESLVGWVGDFIVFQDTPLRVAKREIERRHGVRIELADPELGERTVTALFAGRSFAEIAEVICVIAHLRCIREGDVLKMASSTRLP